MTLAQIYYGSETQKAIENFGRGTLPEILVKAYVQVKKACLMAVQKHESHWSSAEFEALLKTLDEMSAGLHHDQFPLSLSQGGAGTSINMNVNEVIAARAQEILSASNKNEKAKLDPIVDINRYQSTNDTFPTAVNIVLYQEVLEIEKLVVQLQETLVGQEQKHSAVIIVGRTEMQSALPINLGQVWGSMAGSIERDRWRLHKIKERIRTIPLGGTAIGNCFSAPPQYIFLANNYLRELSGLPLCRSQNLPDAIANLDAWSELAHVYNLCAENLLKISSDLMLYTSSFINELKLPKLQYGSSIMAAKTNPVIFEWVKGLSIGIQAEAQKIHHYSQNGQLQLNAFIPFICEAFLKIQHDLKLALGKLINPGIVKLELNHQQIQMNLMQSHVLLNSLISLIPYDRIKTIYLELEKSPASTWEEYQKIVARYSGLEEAQLKQYWSSFQNSTELGKESV